MTFIISFMLLWGLFPDFSDLQKLGLTVFLFLAWVIRNHIKEQQ